MTTDELFAEMEKNIELYADSDEYIELETNDSRIMVIPQRFKTIGVESDEKAERLKFKFPKLVGDSINLSDISIRINYRNANKEVDQNLAENIKVDGDFVIFEWVPTRNVTKYKGDVHFIVCAVETDSEGNVTNEWNTTLATLKSLEGIEVTATSEEEEKARDVLTQLLSEIELKKDDVYKQIEQKAAETIETIPEDYTQIQQEVSSLSEEIINLDESIRKYEYSFPNLFNKETATYGYTLYAGDGVTTYESETESYSDYIEVDPSFDYIRTSSAYKNVFFYDSGKSFISYSNVYQTKFTTPSNCHYVRFNFLTSEKDIIVFIKGTVYPTEYIPYGNMYSLDDNILVKRGNVDFQIDDDMIPEYLKETSLSTEIKSSYSYDKQYKTVVGNCMVFKNSDKGYMIIESENGEEFSARIHGINSLDLSKLILGQYFSLSDGKTLIDNNKEKSGYIDDYILFSPNSDLYFSAMSSPEDSDKIKASYPILYWYDSEKNFIKYQVLAAINGPSSTICKKITSPENAEYYRIAFSSGATIAHTQKMMISDVDTGNTYYGYGSDTPIILNTGKPFYGKTLYFPYNGLTVNKNGIVPTRGIYTKIESKENLVVGIPVIPDFDESILKNVKLKYGRYGNTNYVLARIYKKTIDGKTIMPSILCNTNGGLKISEYANQNDFIVAINAGIFFTDNNNLPIGTVIVDGEVKAEKSENGISHGLYDLVGFNSNGEINSVNYNLSADEIISSGYTNVLMGWCTIINNYDKTDLEQIKESLYPSDGSFGKDYIVTTKHPRTAIGQYRNGDYMVFCCDGRQKNQEGLTLSEMQDIFMEEGVRYAYNLDGGGSCNMYYYKKEIAPFTENRQDPTYFVFR